MSPIRFRTLDTPIGPVTIAGDGDVLTRLEMDEPADVVGRHPDWVEDPTALAAAAAQLEEYFAGTRREFDLELRLDGTPFQQRVWQALREIPYGQTISYRELAARIGQPTAARAVGMANNRNPVAIVVPCHRVIGANGALVGYGGGLERKQLLLDLERKVAASDWSDQSD